MLIWGVLLVLGGLGLIAGQGWARWFAIVVVALNFFASSASSATASTRSGRSTAMALNVIVLYALTARWSESAPELGAAR